MIFGNAKPWDAGVHRQSINVDSDTGLSIRLLPVILWHGGKQPWKRGYQKTMNDRLMADEMWFLQRMLRISGTEKWSTESGRCTAHAIEYNPSTATWFLWLHVMRKHSLEHLAVTGKVEGMRARGRQRLKFLDSLCTCWEDKVSPTQIIMAAEDREDRSLWHQMVANVVLDGMAP